VTARATCSRSALSSRARASSSHASTHRAPSPANPSPAPILVAVLVGGAGREGSVTLRRLRLPGARAGATLTTGVVCSAMASISRGERSCVSVFCTQ